MDDEDGPAQCRAEVVMEEPDRDPRRQTVQGTPSVVAAWLRAVADELVPRKPTTRGEGRVHPLARQDKRTYNQG